MYSSPAQIVELHKSNVDALNTLGHAVFNASEKLVGLNLAVARAVMQEAAEATRTLLGARDIQELMSLSSALGQPALEKAVDYSRNVYAIATGTGAEITRIVEAQINDGNRKVTELIELASRNAPTGSEPLVSMFKSALVASNSAFDTLTKTTKQAADLAESSFAAAASATVNAATAANEVVKAKIRKAA
jgi:phasin family protein